MCLTFLLQRKGKIKMFIPNKKTFAQGCEEYLDNCCACNLRDGTIKHYKESIQQIQKYIDEDMYIKDITKETFDNFIKNRIILVIT